MFVWKVTLPSAVFKMIRNLNTAPRKQTTKHYHDDIIHSNLQFVKIYDLTNDNLIQDIVGKAFRLARLMILHPSPVSSRRTRHPVIHVFQSRSVYHRRTRTAHRPSECHCHIGHQRATRHCKRSQPRLRLLLLLLLLLLYTVTVTVTTGTYLVKLYILKYTR